MNSLEDVQRSFGSLEDVQRFVMGRKQLRRQKKESYPVQSVRLEKSDLHHLRLEFYQSLHENGCPIEDIKFAPDKKSRLFWTNFARFSRRVFVGGELNERYSQKKIILGKKTMCLVLGISPSFVALHDKKQ
jgi:hypothetical protein